MTAIRNTGVEKNTITGVKKRNRKQGRRSRALVTLLLIIAIFLTSFFLPIFNVGHIDVSGNTILTKESIIGASGMQKGTNIFRINLRNCKSKISGIAYVDSVEIKRKLPNRLQINIIEREPVGYLLFMGSHVIIDKYGNVLQVAEAIGNKKIPLLSGIRFTSFKVGEKLEADNKDKLDIFFSCVKELNRNELLTNISKMEVDDSCKVKFEINNKVIIDIGDKSELSYKISFLREILKEINVELPGYVDLSTGKPIFKPISN